MQFIEQVTVGSGGAASITFSNIPQEGFTDLLLVWSGRSSFSDVVVDPQVSFNGSSANFTGRRLFGTGANVFSDSTARRISADPGATATANTFSNGQLYIPNYRSSVAKSFSTDAVGENNGTTAYQMITAGLWNDTSAITTIALSYVAGNFVQHSTASLYGVTAGSDGIVTVS